MRIISTRAVAQSEVQNEYHKLLENEDVVFIQALVFAGGQLRYEHLKGGRYGRRPALLFVYLSTRFHNFHRGDLLRLDYFYSDHNMRSVEVLRN